MSKNCVNVAVVGMGIGRANGMALANNKRGKVVALCDLDQSRMEDFAKERRFLKTFKYHGTDFEV